MLRKIVAVLFCELIIIFTVINPNAVGLPINIDAIGRQESYDNAITSAYNVEIFSAKSAKMNKMIALQDQQKREQLSASLFVASLDSQEMNINAQIIEATSESSLFQTPPSYNDSSIARESDDIPVWVIVVVFLVCIASGFVWAYILIRKKKGA